MWGGFFGKASVHVLGEVHGTEDVADVDRHDEVRVMEVDRIIRGSYLFLKHLYAGGEEVDASRLLWV